MIARVEARLEVARVDDDGVLAAETSLQPVIRWEGDERPSSAGSMVADVLDHEIVEDVLGPESIEDDRFCAFETQRGERVSDEVQTPVRVRAIAIKHMNVDLDARFAIRPLPGIQTNSLDFSIVECRPSAEAFFESFTMKT